MLLVAMCAVTVLVQQRQPIGTAVDGDDPDAQALIAINSREADHAIVAERVVTPEAGWLVVYLQRAGAGPDFDAPVGTAQIQRGESRGVRVPLEQSIAAGTPLSAVLHIDAGSPGGFEYPFGPDEPLTIDGNTVTTPFTLENDAGPVSQ